MDCDDGPGRVAGLLELPCADAPLLIDSAQAPREVLPEVDAAGVAGAVLPNQLCVERFTLRRADMT
jgi:hypothetical protein